MEAVVRDRGQASLGSVVEKLVVRLQYNV